MLSPLPSLPRQATALTSSARVAAEVLALAGRNGALARYGSLQGTVRPVPRAAATRGRWPSPAGPPADRDPLDGVPPVPDDDRAAEVAQAAACGAAVVACVGINVAAGPLGLDGLTPWTNLVLGAALAAVVVDNFYDALVFGGSAVAQLNADKLPAGARKLAAPAKGDLPLGIGTGRLTGSVVRGFGRLLADNTERDCQCEAAAVFAAYVLGLPCFAFQPNALEVRASRACSPRRPLDCVAPRPHSGVPLDARHARGRRWCSSPWRATRTTPTG